MNSAKTMVVVEIPRWLLAVLTLLFFLSGIGLASMIDLVWRIKIL